MCVKETELNSDLCVAQPQGTVCLPYVLNMSNTMPGTIGGRGISHTQREEAHNRAFGSASTVDADSGVILFVMQTVCPSSANAQHGTHCHWAFGGGFAIIKYYVPQ